MERDEVTSKWEERYEHLFKKYSSLNLSYQSEVSNREELEGKMKMLMKENKILLEREKEMENFLTEQISERHLERKEVVSLNEKIRQIMKNLLGEREEKTKQIEHVTFELETKSAKLKKVQRNFTLLREEKIRLREKCEREENRCKTLQEEITHLNTIIKEFKEGEVLKNVKISNTYDRLFSKYVETFFGDESDVRHLFQDRVTQGCNASFCMLLSICYDDLIQNISSIVNVVLDVDSLVSLVIQNSLYTNFNRYLRLLQYKFVHLFSSGGDDATKKTCSMTKHKMKYEDIEIGNARQCFVMALLKNVSNPDVKNSSNSNSEAPKNQMTETHPRRLQGNKMHNLPAGF
jgi:hypothetical protein